MHRDVESIAYVPWKGQIVILALIMTGAVWEKCLSLRLMCLTSVVCSSLGAAIIRKAILFIKYILYYLFLALNKQNKHTAVQKLWQSA